MEFVNRNQCLGIIAPKAFGVLDSDVGETACPRIFQHPLIARAVIGIPAAQIINVFIENGQSGTLKQRMLNRVTLATLRVLWILCLFTAGSQIDCPTWFGGQPFTVSTTHKNLS
ncbi:MAG: hypothetical protein SF029_12800 [bacterium]|nr:hypothetical protein [bacterium]